MNFTKFLRIPFLQNTSGSYFCINIPNPKCFTVKSGLYVLSKVYATFQDQFIKKLSNTEAELKKRRCLLIIKVYSWVKAGENECYIVGCYMLQSWMLTSDFVVFVCHHVA